MTTTLRAGIVLLVGALVITIINGAVARQRADQAGNTSVASTTVASQPGEGPGEGGLAAGAAGELADETTTTAAPTIAPTTTTTAVSSSSTTKPPGTTSTTKPPSTTTTAPAPAPTTTTTPSDGDDVVSGPISMSGEDDVLIENMAVSNPSGDCITVTNSSNVIIRNSTIGPCGGDAVYLSDVEGASVTGNSISNTANGVLVHQSFSIKVDNNSYSNAGRNFVQFDKVNGAGSSVSGNVGGNKLGGSDAEDLINLYQSNGTSGSPIIVAGNHLRNGGPSGSGSGIMLGDGGGSWQTASGNALVDPGQVGIGVASGTNIKVINNLVYSSSHGWSNVGIYVWNQYGSSCGSIEVQGNHVNWTNSSGQTSGWWDGGNCGSIAGVDNNNWNDPGIGPGIY